MWDQYQTGTYIAAISGGPDSMAMLHMAYQAGVQLAVGHVNYKKRANSDQEEEIVRSFCIARGIPFHVRTAPKQTAGGNFQAAARIFRYAFFEDLYEQYHAQGVFTAHHLDDFLETALLRKQQNREVDYYGIQESIYFQGMVIIRPMLSFWKEDLQEYCRQAQIPYGEDESNNSDQYARNRIRNQQLVHYSKEEKLALKLQIDTVNEILKKKQDACDLLVRQLQYKEELPVAVFMQSDEPNLLLRRWLHTLTPEVHHMTNKQLQMISDLAKTSGSHKFVSLSDGSEIRKEYDKLCFLQGSKEIAYSYILTEAKELDTPWFKIRLQGNLRDGITLGKQDFPLTIRNAMPGDAILLNFGHKKLNRYFADRKIPVRQRNIWPVVLNASGEIIFVCGIGSNRKYFSSTPTLFVLK